MSVDTDKARTGGAFEGYAPPEKRPHFEAYAAFSALFNAGLAAGVVAAHRAGHDLPERVDGRDLLLTGVATHKLSRLIAKGKGAPGEVEERARGEGFRRTVGELLICPYCLGMWVSGGFHLGLMTAPRSTRLLASVLSALTIADFLQIAYRAAERKGLGGA